MQNNCFAVAKTRLMLSSLTVRELTEDARMGGRGCGKEGDLLLTRRMILSPQMMPNSVCGTH